MVYIIQKLDDPILDELFDNELAEMCLGTMCSRFDEFITMTYEVAEFYRTKFYYKKRNVYYRKD